MSKMKNRLSKEMVRTSHRADMAREPRASVVLLMHSRLPLYTRFAVENCGAGDGSVSHNMDRIIHHKIASGPDTCVDMENLHRR